MPESNKPMPQGGDPSLNFNGLYKKLSYNYNVSMQNLVAQI